MNAGAHLLQPCCDFLKIYITLKKPLVIIQSSDHNKTVVNVLLWSDVNRAGLSKGLRGAIAQGHHKIGGTTLADCKMDILVAYIIFLKGTYICDPVILIYLP